MSEPLTKELAAEIIPEMQSWEFRFTKDHPAIKALELIASGAHIVVPASDVQEGLQAMREKFVNWLFYEGSASLDSAAGKLAWNAWCAAAQSPPSRWQELERAKVYQAQLVAGENEGAWRDVDAKIYDCLHPSRRRILFTEPPPPAAAPDAEQAL